MAYAPSLAKKWYEDLSVEELKKIYERYKKLVYDYIMENSIIG